MSDTDQEAVGDSDDLGDHVGLMRDLRQICTAREDEFVLVHLLSLASKEVWVDLVFSSWDTALDPPDPACDARSLVCRVDRRFEERIPDTLIVRIAGHLYQLSADHRVQRGGACLGVCFLHECEVDPDVLARAHAPVRCRVSRVSDPLSGQTIGVELRRVDSSEVLASAVVETREYRMPRRHARVAMLSRVATSVQPAEGADDEFIETTKLVADLSEVTNATPTRVEVVSPDGASPISWVLLVDDRIIDGHLGSWGAASHSRGRIEWLRCSLATARRSIVVNVTRRRRSGDGLDPLVADLVLEGDDDPAPAPASARRVVLYERATTNFRGKIP